MVEFNEEKQNKQLDDLRKREQEALARTLSEKYNLPYIDLTLMPVDMDALRLMKEEDAREAKMAVFNVKDKDVSVAVLSPNNPHVDEHVKKLEEKGYKASRFMVSEESLKKVWDRYKDLSFSFETKGGALDISNEEIMKVVNAVNTIEDVRALIREVLTLKKAYRISRIVEIVLAGALSIHASDVHIEPQEESVRLRFRLDGVLVDVLNFDTETFHLLLSRIKLLSGLKLNIKNQAQDGRFTIKVGENDIEIRSSILPGAYSESIVLRVLNPQTISVPLEELGMHPRLLSLVEREIRKPNGMILTTGPTGSGKTTTLYAFLKKVYTPEIKVITIENPIEYHLGGIVQTQTNEKEGYTFHSGLRSALRQDPDIIMVGEIRDSETAQTAIDAALTGHLVFSTLHTNNAAGSFPRLIDLGVNSKVITSAVNISMAQRLVRKLCDACKVQKPLGGETAEKINRVLDTVTDPSYLEGLDTSSLWEAGGCKECNDTGFKGRIGVFEAIVTDETIEKVVNQNPSEREISAAAADQHLLTLPQDGVLKVLKGVTSLSELERVVELSEISS